jgi:hypothetical protein
VKPYRLLPACVASTQVVTPLPFLIDLPALPIVALDCPAELERRRGQGLFSEPALAHNLRTRDCRAQDSSQFCSRATVGEVSG